MNETQKQEAIVRQSQLKWTFDYLKQINLNLPLKDICGIVNVMTDYCLKGYSKDIAGRLEAIDKFIKTKFDEEQ
jgi:predicted GNAT superfamily acetyltransferase